MDSILHISSSIMLRLTFAFKFIYSLKFDKFRAIKYSLSISFLLGTIKEIKDLYIGRQPLINSVKDLSSDLLGLIIFLIIIEYIVNKNIY